MKYNQTVLIPIIPHDKINQGDQISQYFKLNGNTLELCFGQARISLNKNGEVKFSNDQSEIAINSNGQIHISSNNQVKIFARERIDLN